MFYLMLALIKFSNQETAPPAHSGQHFTAVEAKMSLKLSLMGWVQYNFNSTHTHVNGGQGKLNTGMHTNEAWVCFISQYMALLISLYYKLSGFQSSWISLSIMKRHMSIMNSGRQTNWNPFFNFNHSGAVKLNFS